MSTDDLVNYRISRANESYNEAILLAKENHWNTTANRLYYACFYMVNALLIKNGVSFSSHNGVKSEFHRLFVKEDIISVDNGKLFNRLFNLRHEGDYADFKRLEEEDVQPFIDDVKTFILE